MNERTIGLIIDRDKKDFYKENKLKIINDDVLSTIDTLYVFGCENIIDYPGPKNQFITSVIINHPNIKNIYFYINGDKLFVNTVVSHETLLEDFNIKIGYYVNPINKECWIRFISQLYCDVELICLDVFSRVKAFAKYSKVFVDEDILKESVDNYKEVLLFLCTLGFEINTKICIEKEIEMYKLHCLL